MIYPFIVEQNWFVKNETQTGHGRTHILIFIFCVSVHSCVDCVLYGIYKMHIFIPRKVKISSVHVTSKPDYPYLCTVLKKQHKSMNAIVTQMVILFIIVIIGYFLSKKKMMDADFDRKLSVLVINVTCPSLILSSVMGDTLPDKGFILPLLIVGFATYIVLIGGAFLLPRILPVKAADRGIYSFMLAFGNVGFIGYPIVASIFGANAVFYACILNFPSTLLIFVFGTLFVSGGEGKVRFDWRTLYCPAMIASYLSILIVVTGWIPPKVLSTPFVLLGNITVPAALLIVGSSIAQVPIWRMFSNTAIYLMSALRLMLVPLLILYLSRLCRVEETIANINVVLAAMPVASYGTLFCIQYGKGEVIMAEGTFITTLLSVISIPLLTMFL